MPSDGASSRELYEAFKPEIDRRFPSGRFVAMEGDQIIADAENHRTLIECLKALGKNPQDMMIVQAGADYPETALIF